MNFMDKRSSISMEKELKKYKTYIGNIKGLLKICGLWPNVNPIFSYPIAFMVFCLNFLLALAVMNFCLHHITNIMIVTKGMGLVIGLTTAFIKVSIFLNHRDDLIYLNENLTKIYLEDMKNPENHSRLLSRISLYSIFFYTQTISVFMVIVMYAVIPFVTLAKHGKYMRMLPVIYPFDIQPGGFIHWLLYLIEFVGSMYLSAVTAGVDCSFGMYSMQTSSELNILADKFKRLHAGKDYKKDIKDCAKRHQMLYNVKKKLENLYGFIAIWLAITAAVVLCTLIFQLTEAIKSKTASLQLGLLMLYIVLKFSQAFSFATYGNDISDESKSCLDAIYQSNWYQTYSKSFKNDALIVLIQRPIVLVAKGCMLIQLDMFAKIVNTSVSYFFLLQTLNEETE